MVSYRVAALLALVLLPLLAGCGGGRDTVTVGAKNFGESAILANMFAILAREKGMTVAGPIEYPTTQSVLEALKAGDIDIYPDYNGTGLVMVGQNPLSDGDEAMVRVEQLYAPLGLTWLPRLGFANNYGLAMRDSRARELGIRTISDLAAKAEGLTLGLEADFQVRPLDGLQPLTARYGMSFEDLSVVPLDERGVIYDRLLDGKIDVGEVYTTDGQIADFGMVLLEDDLSFFPVYEAAPLARTDSLSRHGDLGPAIRTLAGKINAEKMRELNSSVEIDGRPPEIVARAALVEMGLVEGGVIATEDPLVISSSEPLAGTALSNAALRAVRKAFPGREIELDPVGDPLPQVADGRARMALVDAGAFFDLSGQAPIRDERFEAVAAIGQTVVHLLSRMPVDQVKAIAVGPPGSASNRLGSLFIAGLGLNAALSPAPAETADALLAKVGTGEVQAVLIAAPIGQPLVERLTENTGLALQSLGGWKEKANLVRYPFLREVRIPAGTYPGQPAAIDTLGSQVVLAGMAPITTGLVGDKGPSAVETSISALPDAAVTKLVAALPGTTLIDPTLKPASALAPPKPKLPAEINPAFDVSLLNLAIVVMIGWFGWLYMRPERR
jgi:glycine betaine/choline ABC-type transport system substrate-binding protein